MAPLFSNLFFSALLIALGLLIAALIGGIYYFREQAKGYRRELDHIGQKNDTLSSDNNLMAEELLNAQEVQAILLPSPSELNSFNLFGANIPARQVSGDYYDYIDLPNQHTGVVIADVSGKGVPAGLVMATFRSALRTLASKSPSDSLSALNEEIFSDIRDDMFISSIYANLDDQDGTVSLARAGHNPPYYYSAKEKKLEKIKSPGLAVGLDDGNVFNSIIKDHKVTMSAGDKLILYTDGIIEALNQKNEEFTSERLEEVLKTYGNEPAEKLGSMVLGSVAAFTEGAKPSDDITLVVVERK